MAALILYEFKKIFKDVKNIIVIVLFIVFMVGFVFINEKTDKSKNENWINELKSKSTAITSQINRLSEDDDIPYSEKEKDLNFLYEHEKLMEKIIKEYKNKNLQGYLLAQKDLDNHAIEGVNQGIDLYDRKSVEEYKFSIQKLDIMIEKNIRPIFEDSCMEGYNFLRLCSSDIILIILVVVMLNLVAECFCIEAEKGTYKLLFIQPVSKVKIFFSKFISRFIVSIVAMTLIISVIFVVLGLKNGFGNLEYPVAAFLNEGISYMSLGQFLRSSVPLLFIALLFYFCFAMFISCCVNNTTVAVSMDIFIPITFIFMCELILPLKPFIAFSYIPVNDFLSSAQYGIMNGNATGAMIFLLLASLCMAIASLFVLNTKSYKK